MRRVERAQLAIDPAPAERDIDRVRFAEADGAVALLGQFQPEAGGFGICGDPAGEGGGIDKCVDRQVVRHVTTFAA